MPTLLHSQREILDAAKTVVAKNEKLTAECDALLLENDAIHEENARLRSLLSSLVGAVDGMEALAVSAPAWTEDAWERAFSGVLTAADAARGARR